MKVPGSHEHSPSSLPKSAIQKIEIIATMPNSQKAFQDGMAVVRSSSTAEVQINCSESTAQYATSKVRVRKLFLVPTVVYVLSYVRVCM